MSELKWRHQVPTEQGWYWVSWPNGGVRMWFFDGSNEDTDTLVRADRFYGPLEPPELPPDD